MIDVTGLSKYFNGKCAVDKIDLKIEKGEIFGFLGANGSGKTTMIRMLCGLLVPDAGSGHCLGFDILTQSDCIKRQAGYMTQRFSLYEDLTVLENLYFIGRLYHVDTLQEKIKFIIHIFDFEKYQRQCVATLSGGWKQRLALACCLLHAPKLLLLDEPTAGVDPKSRREFWDILYEQSEQGVTILVSTHYMDEAERCTRLAYLAHGNLLTSGTPREVIQKSNLTTWIVTGDHLSILSEKLKLLPGVDQVVFFGKALHVSGKNAELLKAHIQLFQKNDYAWTLSKPGLEEVFIDLVSEEHP